MTELDELFASKPNLATSSKAQYTSHYKKITDAIGGQISLTPDITIIKAMNKIYNTASSKWAAISVPIIIFNNNNLPVDKLEAYREIILQEKQEHLKDRNKDKNTTLPELNELTNYLKTLMTNSDYRSFVINYLLTNYGVRNEDIDCFITSDKKQLADKSRNYLLVSPTKIKWIRNIYKTAKTYGSKTIDIKNIDFIIAINELPSNEWLLVSPSGDHIASNSVGKYIQDRTYNGLSEGDIFKVLVRHATKNGKNVLTKLKQLSDWRGTDIKTIADNYDIDLM